MPRLLSNQGLQLCHIVLLALTTNAIFSKANCVIQTSYFSFKKLLFCHIYSVAGLFDHFYFTAGWAEEEVRGGEVLEHAGCGSSSRTAQQRAFSALPLTSAPATVFLQFVLFQMFHQIYLLIPKLKLNGLGKSECVSIQPSDLPTRVGATLQCKKLEVLSATPCSNTTPAT